jgi:excisionase family DNA binding protein
MRAADAIRLTEETARQLRAGGAEDSAQALESVLSVAIAALGVQRVGQPPEYLTPAQAARALGVSVRVVKRLMATGEIESERVDGGVVLSRPAVLAFAQAAGDGSAGEPARSSGDVAEEGRRHAFVVKGLPAEQWSRFEALQERVEAGEQLSAAEHAEMAALEHAVVNAASDRLQAWTNRPRALER